jgi:hypothetical protein
LLVAHAVWLDSAGTEQTTLRGKRVSLISVLEPEVSFDAAYRVGSITSKEYIEIKTA